MIENKEKLTTFLFVALRNFVVTHLAIRRLEKKPILPKTVTFGIKKKKQEITVNLKDLCTIDSSFSKVTQANVPISYI